MKLTNLALIGLLQSLGVVLYCGLIASFFKYAENIGPEPGILGMVLMLMLLVVSAAITGSLVFGYAAYLAMQQKLKEALQLAGYTLLFCAVLIIIIIGILGVLF